MWRNLKFLHIISHSLSVMRRKLIYLHIFSHERFGNFYDSSTSVMYRIIFGCPVKKITPKLESTMTILTSAIWPKLCLLSIDICWHYAIYFSTNFPMTKFLPSLSLLSRCPFGNLLKFGKLYDIIIVYSKGNIFLPTNPTFLV